MEVTKWLQPSDSVSRNTVAARVCRREGGDGGGVVVTEAKLLIGSAEQTDVHAISAAGFDHGLCAPRRSNPRLDGSISPTAHSMRRFPAGDAPA